MARTGTGIRARRAPRRPAPSSLLERTDFTAYLREHAEQLAPGDLRTLLAQTKSVRARAAQEEMRHPRVPRQVNLAMDIVTDHARGRCPQIPFYTIAVLATALLYFTDPLDAIPDWIPTVGKTDDALVLELAFALARPGVERYCAWKDIPTNGVLYEAPQRPARPPRL